MRTSRPTAALALLSFTAYACGEGPTAISDRAAPDSTRPSFKDTELITCNFSHPDAAQPGMYRYGWLRFHAPKSAVGTDPGTISYKVYFDGSGERPWGVVDCNIPNSQAFIDYMNLRVAGGRGRRVSRPPAGATASYASTSDLQPVVVMAPAPTNWGPAGWDGGGGPCNWYYEECYDSSQGDYGGGGYSEPPPLDQPVCDPAIDPICEQPFTAADSATINSSTLEFLRQPSTITDPANRQKCQEMINKVNSMFAEGKIYRGAYTTTQTDGIYDGPDHYGGYSRLTKHIHVEPLVLDNAANGNDEWQYILVRDLLHEAAHALGYEHPPNDGSGYAGHYETPPFNLLDFYPDHCLQ